LAKSDGEPAGTRYPEPLSRLFHKPGCRPCPEQRLAAWGSFQLGGPVQLGIDVSDGQLLPELRAALADLDMPSLLIGEGSNILFSDEGWRGVLVRLVEPIASWQPDEGSIWVPAGINLDDLVACCVEAGFAGMEAFSGIPGSLGGAVAGNAGAWGKQVGDLIQAVRLVDDQGGGIERSADACAFQYRDSALKREGCWIQQVALQLHRGSRAELRTERERILAIRKDKHPDWRAEPCIGSFFRNIEPSSAAERRQAAGWFLEQAGAKDLKQGGAALFRKHANIPVKAHAECRSADVAELARRMQQVVRERFGFELHREVRYLGAMPGEEAHLGFY